MAGGQRMHGSPSPMHEERRQTLTAIGMLAGFNVPLLTLPDGKVPDVALVSLSNGALLIGDAKHSEGPNDPASQDRLAIYLTWLRRDRPTKRADIFAVCHPPGQGTAWTAAINLLAARAGVVTGNPQTGIVGPTSALSWIPCFGGFDTYYSAARGRTT
jgi:hypothetical protein